MKAYDRYTRAVQMLVDRGFTEEEVRSITIDIFTSFKQGIGLGGGEMDEIIENSLNTRDERNWENLGKALDHLKEKWSVK